MEVDDEGDTSSSRNARASDFEKKMKAFPIYNRIDFVSHWHYHTTIVIHIFISHRSLITKFIPLFLHCTKRMPLRR